MNKAKKFTSIFLALMTAVPFAASADVVKEKSFEDMQGAESWVYDTAKIYTKNKDSAEVFVFEDFNHWSIDSLRNQLNLGEKTIISQDSGYNKLPVGFKKFTNQVASPKTVARLGTDEDSYFGYIGSGNSYPLIGQQYNNNANFCGNAPWLRPGNKDWVDFSGTVLLSYDFLVPNLNTVSDRLGNTQIVHWPTGMSWNKYVICDMPVIYVTDGTVFARGKNAEGGNISMAVSNAEPGDWVRLQTAVVRDKDAGTTTVRQYVNGVLIGGAAVCVYNNSDFAYESEYPNGCGTDANNGIGVYSTYYSQNDTDWHGIDNLTLSVYEGTSIQPLASVSEVLSDGIAVYNTAVDAEYEGHITPECARRGYLDLSSAKITAVKYGADDPLMIKGENVDGVTFANVKGSKETIYPEPKVYGVTEDGSKIILDNLPNLSAGERMRINISGAEDVCGNDVDTSVMIYSDDAESVPFYDYEFGFFFDGENTVQKEDDAYIVPASLSAMKFKTTDTSGEMKVRDADGEVISAYPNDGMYDLTFTDMLTVGKLYTVSYNGEDVFNFKTVSKGFEWLADASSDNISLKYINSTENDIDVHFVGAKYNAEGKMIDIADEVFPCTSKNQDTVTLTKTLSGEGKNKAFLWEKDKMSVTDKAGSKISVTLFDASGKSNVSGALGTEYAGKNVDILVLNKDNRAVYATNVNADKSGNYSADIYIDTSVEDIFTVYLRADEKIYKKVKYYSTSSKNSTAISKLNGAVSAAEVQNIISDNKEELEFDNEYASEVNELSVAELLYTYIKSLSNGLDINDKAAAVKAYNYCVAIQLFTQSGVKDIADVSEYIGYLTTAPIKNWYDYRGDVTSSYTDKWHDGIVSRLSNVGFSSITDFENKLTAAFTFSVIKDSGSTETLVNYFKDIASKIALDESLIKSSVVSKVVGRNYNGFDYEQLKSDMSQIDSENSRNNNSNNTGKNTGSSSGRNSGTVTVPSNSNQVTPVETERFSDMSDAEWALDAVSNLSKLGIVSGKGNNLFAPNDYVTREEFVKMIVNAASLELDNEVKKFDDVSKDSWYYQFVNTAYNAGIVSGISDTEFGSGLNITRQDIAVMVYNAIKYKKAVLNDKYEDFSDKDSISVYAADAVSYLAGAKIINGYNDGSFLPSANATRAEATKIIYEALKYLTQR